jgi:DNA-binding MarR family transcriptional regulator/GNAT superfamily N-acetyltransferase
MTFEERAMPARRETEPPTRVAREQVEGVRRFNRFYTGVIGVIDEGHLGSPFSLLEVRVLFEVANRADTTASALVQALGVDAGQMSRVLARLVRRRLVARTRSTSDARVHRLSLTTGGVKAFASLDRDARRQVESLLGVLPSDDRRRLLGAMDRVRAILSGSETRPDEGYLLRTHQAGDMGWIVHRHGALYAHEHGWDARFESLVARIVADFIDGFDARWDRCWIAERDGENVGSVFVTRHPERPGVAKLRLLLVEPSARGLGIGRRLVDECTRFARAAGYRTITLWTNDVLTAARNIYERAGYHRVKSERHTSFGAELTAETWELELR